MVIFIDVKIIEYIVNLLLRKFGVRAELRELIMSDFMMGEKLF